MMPQHLFWQIWNQQEIRIWLGVYIFCNEYKSLLSFHVFKHILCKLSLLERQITVLSKGSAHTWWPKWEMTNVQATVTFSNICTRKMALGTHSSTKKVGWGSTQPCLALSKGRGTRPTGHLSHVPGLLSTPSCPSMVFMAQLPGWEWQLDPARDISGLYRQVFPHSPSMPLEFPWTSLSRGCAVRDGD